MVELGKYGTEFVVKKSYWYLKLEQPIPNHSVVFEGFVCYVSNVYDDSVVLRLISNNPNDCIMLD